MNNSKQEKCIKLSTDTASEPTEKIDGAKFLLISVLYCSIPNEYVGTFLFPLVNKYERICEANVSTIFKQNL